ncbi:cytochrome P450 [Halocatena pleomorpha]|uniref:Cytochrome P450 n=1 Tax=Halocatena pleomorpha TaxID=1785090 RepID=A0A3P3RMI9_9EURY|nr:cytochrome P450 [Halocatena pleomorpha]RRJ34078.1 cytochrome P450 [Halocatena pleomorpha]
MTSNGPPTQLGQIPTELALTERQLDPFPWYETMRETAPVRYDEKRDCWDIFRYNDIDTVLCNHEQFSSRLSSTDGSTRGTSPGERKDTMIRVDPPEHGRLRGPVDEHFTAGSLRNYRPELERLVDETLDKALADGSEIEIVSEVAFPITIGVIAELLGLPTNDRDQFIQWSRGMLPPQKTRGEDPRRERTNPVNKIHKYFEEIIDERKRNPGDGLISELVRYGEDGSRLTEKEVFDTCNLLLGAGHITSVSLLTSAIWMFAKHNIVPEIRDGSISLDSAVDEVLRYRSPLHTMPRITRTEVEVGDTQIPKGERVVAWIGSANRDEQEFETPAEFVPTRTPNRHIAFGAGAHYCLGAPLARLEADVALSKFFERVYEIEITTRKCEPIVHPTLHGIKSLQIDVGTEL